MQSWPKDNTPAKIAFYGDPRGPHGENQIWRAAAEKRIVAPFQMYYAGQPIKSITVHKRIADAVLAAFNDIWQACGKDQKAVDKTGASDWGGCFNYRVIAGSANLSNHSFGCAVDLSPRTNGFNAGKGTIANIVVDAFKRQGAYWGGDYKGRTDPMHFEFVTR
jgi:hypothetical protein